MVGDWEEMVVCLQNWVNYVLKWTQSKACCKKCAGDEKTSKMQVAYVKIQRREGR